MLAGPNTSMAGPSRACVATWWKFPERHCYATSLCSLGAASNKQTDQLLVLSNYSPSYNILCDQIAIYLLFTVSHLLKKTFFFYQPPAPCTIPPSGLLFSDCLHVCWLSKLWAKILIALLCKFRRRPFSELECYEGITPWWLITPG